MDTSSSVGIFVAFSVFIGGYVLLFRHVLHVLQEQQQAFARVVLELEAHAVRAAQLHRFVSAVQEELLAPEPKAPLAAPKRRRPKKNA